jgi:hypothetical protein
METETIPQRIDVLLQGKQYRKVSDLLQKVIFIEIKKQNDTKKVIDFFSKIYDIMYYDILFGKFDMDKVIIKQLESLAMPIQSRSKEEWKKLFEKISKNK